MKSKRILVIGANGQLGQAFRNLNPIPKAMEFVFLDRNSLSIEAFPTVSNYLSLVQFDYCINCAAYTAVDKAEAEREQALVINAGAVENLAQCCGDKGVRLIHFSTDYVFDGLSSTPYREDDPAHPINFYGFTKRQGEERSLERNPGMVIIRTSWLYSPWGQNFLKTMIRLMKERSMIKIVNDQWGSPTYAPDLAEAVIRIIQAEDFVPGIYHFSNEGKISWYEFARAIKEMIRSECELFPITTEEYPTAAKRPKFSLLDCSKIQIIYGVKLKPWHSSLKACVNRLILMK